MFVFAPLVITRRKTPGVVTSLVNAVEVIRVQALFPFGRFFKVEFRGAAEVVEHLIFEDEALRVVINQVSGLADVRFYGGLLLFLYFTDVQAPGNHLPRPR